MHRFRRRPALIAPALVLCAILAAAGPSLAGEVQARPAWGRGVSTADLFRPAGEVWPMELPSLSDARWLHSEESHRLPGEALFRGQSPEISLLPLADQSASTETVGLLGPLAGVVTPLVLGEGRLRGDYVTDFDGTEKIGMQILTQGGLGAGIDAEVNYWQRPIPGQGREPLWTGDVNMIYNVSPISRFRLRGGVGGSWMILDEEAKYGYNFTYGLDVYTLWRLMFTGEIDYGKIDSDELFRYRLGAGLTFNSFDIFAGYESQEIGSEELDGWMAGVAVWY